MGALPLAAPDFDADPLVEWMLNRVCNSRIPLKSLFEDYTRGKINGGLDWVEVDGLVGALTTRYPPRMEQTRGMFGGNPDALNGWWVPPPVFEKYKQDELPPGYIQGGSAFFCHSMTVTALDHTFLPRHLARSYPAVSLGGWTSIVELVTMLGMGIYTAVCAHDLSLSSARIQSTGTDRLLRTAYLRRATEEWKEAGGNPGDLVVCPNAATNSSGRRQAYVRGTAKFLGMIGLGAVMLGANRLQWSWDGNLARQTPITHTGLRTPPSMWVNQFNVKPAPVTVEGIARSVENGRWFKGRIVQSGEGAQNMELERFFGRMDWVTATPALSSMTWPGRDMSTRLAYNLESTFQLGRWVRDDTYG